MGRPLRIEFPGAIYHVMSRGNQRRAIFDDAGDYQRLLQRLEQSVRRFGWELLSFALMLNHWHLVVRPRTDEALGRLMRWVGVTHVRRHQEHYNRRGAGHLYQGRYKRFPVAEDDSFLTLCRYVEANPVRARLVERADQWQRSGFWRRLHARRDLPLCRWPIGRPRNWTALVNGGLAPEEMKTVRQCVIRGRPLGTEAWIEATASRLGLGFTLRNPGRPRKQAENL